mmetsp:Transcript_6842/g.6664  ORF Transcript_6842/g.6664 Transcript_6842/m.6664 type:complete len:280 (-) Transcript_6842:145-984(-)
MKTLVYPPSLPSESLNNYVTLFSAVAVADADTRTTTSYTSPLHNNNDGGNDKYVYVFDATSSAVTIHDGIPFAVNDGISSATSADEAPNDCYYGNTAVLIASPSIVIDTESSSVSVADELMSSVTMTTPDTAVTPTITSYGSNADTININTTSYGLDTNEMSVTVVTTTTYDTMLDLHCNSISTTDVDVISSTTVTMKANSSALNLNDMSLMFSCLSSNYFSLILLCKSSRRQFDQMTLVLSTLLSLHRTLQLIVQSLISILSLVDIHLMMHIIPLSEY